MNQYHKIQTVFKRNPVTNFKTLLNNYFSLPEFEYLASNQWRFDEKIDGTNIRVIFDGKEIQFKLMMDGESKKCYFKDNSNFEMETLEVFDRNIKF